MGDLLTYSANEFCNFVDNLNGAAISQVPKRAPNAKQKAKDESWLSG